MGKVNVGTNWVRDLWYDPCDPNPWIFLELAFPALIQAIWEYIQWDWEDYYENIRGKSWQKDMKTVVTASKWQPPKAVSRGTMFLFLAEAGVQRIAWMFMVAEIVADAFIRWCSLIASLPECNETITSDWGSSKSPIDGRPLSRDWMIGPSWTTEAGTMFPYIGATWTVPAGGAVYYTTFQRYANFFTGKELKVITRIVDVESGNPIAEAPVNDPDDPQNRSSAIHGKYRNAGLLPKTFNFEVKLVDETNPLIWHCIGDFISVRIFAPSEVPPKLTLPYIPTFQPSRRHAKKRPWNRKQANGTPSA